ncbi:hypothetical protein L3X38_000072 [Prunus dulcis]|uniref:UspA domain-containing protein n=1 Tax=Prunus dulcis TaxID=3755 RepID=A0AAD4YJH4_PRUDU|nr:hypothetical protein L3X38_000072 [Prunus dulcis]
MQKHSGHESKLREHGEGLEVEVRVENGDMRDVICKMAKQLGADVVMGSHGYGLHLSLCQRRLSIVIAREVHVHQSWSRQTLSRALCRHRQGRAWWWCSVLGQRRSSSHPSLSVLILSCLGS